MRRLVTICMLATGCDKLFGLQQIDEPDVGPDMVTASCAELAARGEPVLFCDGFESGGLGAWDAMAVSNNATLTVVMTPVVAGAHTMHAHIDGLTSTDGEAKVTAIVKAPLPVVWIRIFMDAPALPASSTHDAIGFVQSESPYSGTLLSFSSGEFQLYNTRSATLRTGPSVPMGWTCLEMRLDLASAGGGVEVFIDGVQIFAVDETVQLQPPLTMLVIGPAAYAPRNTQPAIDLYFDEVAIGDTRIACTR